MQFEIACDDDVMQLWMRRQKPKQMGRNHLLQTLEEFDVGFWRKAQW
jgi:hypothetical protein